MPSGLSSRHVSLGEFTSGGAPVCRRACLCMGGELVLVTDTAKRSCGRQPRRVRGRRSRRSSSAEPLTATCDVPQGGHAHPGQCVDVSHVLAPTHQQPAIYTLRDGTYTKQKRRGSDRRDAPSLRTTGLDWAVEPPRRDAVPEIGAQQVVRAWDGRYRIAKLFRNQFRGQRRRARHGQNLGADHPSAAAELAPHHSASNESCPAIKRSRRQLEAASESWTP